MCGRFALSADIAAVSEHFRLTRNIVLTPRYNIAPGNVIPAIRVAGQIEFLMWGLRPAWLKDEQTAFTNARMETLQEKPAFRQAFKTQRCLIVANGYYEWKPIGKIKQPYYISLSQQQVFAFAGLWDGDSCTIITTAANQPALVNIHERMPVIVAANNYATWLNPKADPIAVQQCMLNNDLPTLQVFPVSTKMNNPKHDFAECIKALQ